MNKSIELDGNQAGIIIQALEQWIDKKRDLGDRMILGTTSSMSGFMHHDDATVGQELVDALDELFPALDDVE